MKVLKGYEPQAVFEYFEKICSIPHGSGNTKKLSDWIVAFAEGRCLEYSQDEYGNVIIRKDASIGYEEKPGIIMQGHMDMVAVKTEGCQKDLEHEGLDIAIKDGNIYAKGTSLGGDDGIAVAYMLAILGDENIKHPSLEMVFTTDEEVGLQGISKMDVSSLKGRRLINLDIEDEGVMMAGCAGGIKAVCSFPMEWENVSGEIYELKVSGLVGGHSGTEINKERGNASIIITRTLYELQKLEIVHVVSLEGGEKDNAIPNSAKCTFVTDAGETEVSGIVEGLLENLKRELLGKDDNVNIILTSQGTGKVKAVTDQCFRTICLCMLMTPNGVQAMSSSIKDTVETSLNCGIMRLRDNDFLARFALRSSIRSSKKFLFERIKTFAESMGGVVTAEGDYPPWEFDENSEFRESVMDIYEKMYNKPMEIQVIHAGLECGYLSEQIPGLDCVAIGPDMRKIHTTDETLNIESVRRVWEFTLRVIRES